MRKILPVLILVLFSCCFFEKARAQYVTVSGTVYDITARRPLEAVGVISSSGRGTITDSMGRYSIVLPVKDSIWFSLIGKTTMKYPIDTITNLDRFDVRIHMRANDLPEVKVRNSYYRYDSLQNRIDNAKAFNFRKPGLRLSTNPNYNPGGLTAGFDLDEIINLFRVNRTRSLAALQKRLIDQEHDKYVSSRFTKQLVRKITRLQSPELDTFMVRYRPDYEFVSRLNDLELGYFIQRNFEAYKAAKYNWRGGLRRRDEKQ